jgi:hypothetical protein
MSNRKLIVIAFLATIIGSTAACADVTGPTQQKSQFCQVTNGGGTCVE